jgi:hypothetical protein
MTWLNPHADDLEEPGGVLVESGDTPVFTEDPEYCELEDAGDTDADAGAHELGEALLAMCATITPIPAESTAGIELSSATESVAASKAEALEPRLKGEAGHWNGVPRLPRKEGAQA